MPISEQTLQTLEFPKIRDQLARHTSFSASRELALSLLPSTDLADVRQRVAFTTEARALLDETPDVSIGGTRDVRPSVQRALRGGVLDGGVLLEIANTLGAARALRTRLMKLDADEFALLAERAITLPNLPVIEEAITRAIDDDGSVRDNASPELARLRREVRIAFGRLQDKLQNMVTSSQYGDALQEPIITVRNGRYVVPVKAGQRRSLPGLVHDQSGSGATLYIEPLATVELNNRWREMQLAEEDEVARILAELSDRVGTAAPEIIAGVETLAALDLVFAQAKYAEALRCVAPTLHEATTEADAPPLQLTQARHPLLDQRTVVPIDLWLGDTFRLLLITGPNTGGKTVALKTTGLLALMAQAGLHIPADAPSRLPVFGQVFADIGDEQSIEQSLSTFSSHMTNIIHILGALEADPWDNATYDADQYALLAGEQPPALVLFDELGAGTDPVEGAALARAIIERLLDINCLGIATTHYAELKAFAYNTPGVQNASVEFDLETLAPTYRLSIGLPGRSNALAIASRLGLAAALIERARSTINREDAQVEDLLAGIYREREEATGERARVEELRADAEKYRERLAAELQAFEDTRAAQADAARRELEDELRDARNLLRRLRDDFRNVSLSRQWLEEAEQRVSEAQSQVRDATERTRRTRTPEPPPPEQAPRPLQVGDTVHVRSVGLNGEIVAIDAEDGEADVQVGGFRMHVDLRELRREKDKDKPDRAEQYAQQSRAVSTTPPPDVSMTFDMRGWRASEVADRLDRYLNDAYLAGLQQVRLIHGKGTGTLRQIVRDTLQSHPLVTSFSGGGRDGGEGVTVAEMNNA